MRHNKIMTSLYNHELHGLNLGLLHTSVKTVGVLANATIAPSEEKTLCDLSGMGVIQNIWLTFIEEHVARAARIRVYVDGEETPSIDFDMGSIGLALHTDQGFRGGWCKGLGRY
ncbi:MAG: hypothetical protein AB1847_21495 [bacterium]